MWTETHKLKLSPLANYVCSVCETNERQTENFFIVVQALTDLVAN